MFACFLARTVAHTIDVFGMLDSMPRGLFRFWQRVYEVDPWGDKEDWDRATMIAAAANNAGVIAAGQMGDRPVRIYPEIETYLKKPEAAKPKAKEESPEQGQAILASRFGPKP